MLAEVNVTASISTENVAVIVLASEMSRAFAVGVVDTTVTDATFYRM
jgi:hypothetical protein